MRKPFHSLPLINILNSSDNTQPKMWDDLHMICPGVRVLVVDDEPMNLMVARGILSDYRMEVETAESGMEAIEICGKENFDLLFLDHMMPSMDGVETLHHIRKLMDETNRNITAIAFTANAVSGAREFYLSHGFDDYLAKPIQGEKLEQLLCQYLPPQFLKIPEEETVDYLEELCIPPIDGIVADDALRYAGGDQEE